MAKKSKITWIDRLLGGNFSVRPVDDYFKQAVNGNITGVEIVRVFGRDPTIGTSLSPIATSNTYQTPTAAQSLEVLSSSAADAVGGGGATKIFIEGLDSTFNIQSETITLTGTTPVALANDYIRITKMDVSESEAYASLSGSASHQGDITLRDVATGAVIWAQIIREAGFGIGSSLIGGYTVPVNKKATLYMDKISVDSGKVSNIYIFARESADDVTTPYSAMIALQAYTGISGTSQIDNFIPIEDVSGAVDIIPCADVTSGSADVSIDYYVILEDV